jgi:hypothetical protein
MIAEIPVDQGSLNYGPQAECDPPYVFIWHANVINKYKSDYIFYISFFVTEEIEKIVQILHCQ